MSDYSKIIAVEARPYHRAAVYLTDVNGERKTVFADRDELASLRLFKQRCARSDVQFVGRGLAKRWVWLIARLWREVECITT